MLPQKSLIRIFIFTLLIAPFISAAQDSVAYQWKVSSKKIADNTYELNFTTAGNSNWQLYAPNEILSDVPAAEISFDDSAVVKNGPFKETGNSKKIASKLFDGASFNVYEQAASFTATVTIPGKVPAKLLGKFSYTYGKGDELYPLTPYSFSVDLEGGVASEVRIKIKSFDLSHPVSNCGDESTGGKSLAGIFFLGLLGGFIALLTPCVFPLIPLTVSFFTKKISRK